MDKTVKKRLVSGGAWVFGGRVFSMSSQLAVNGFLARLLSPTDMGLYFLVFSLVNFFMMFSLLGMQRSIVRIISESLALERPEKSVLAVRYMIQIGAFTSISLAIVLFAGAGKFISEMIFNTKLIGNLVYLPAAWLIIFTLQTLIAEAFRGFHDIRYATIFNGLISSAICTFVFGFLLFIGKKVDLEIVLIITIGSYFINFIFASTLLYRLTSKIEKTKRELITRYDMLKNSWVLYFQNLILFIMTSGHLWLLAYLSTKQNVAIYGAVFRLMVIITTSLAMIRLTILPTIGHLYAKKYYSEVEKVLKVSALVAGIPAILGLSLVILMGKPILFILYGSHYAEGYSALIILSVANLINVFTGMPGPLMVMASKEKQMLLFTIISSVVGLSLSSFLIGILDYTGVSIGAGTGIILYNILMAWYCKSKLSISTTISLNQFYSSMSTIRNRGFQYIFK